jgi:hypothetical protein
MADFYAPVLASDIASFATSATAAERQSHGKVRRKHAVKVEEVVQKFLAGAVPPASTSCTAAPVTAPLLLGAIPSQSAWSKSILL